ncbi:MAG: biotin-dependent carboxyltransferase family protein [Kiloniellales bacterium]
MTAQLEVLSAGPSITVQDRGRPGFQRYGVAGGGALDPYALAEGAALLGNPGDAAALELFGLGGSFRALEQPLRFALSGAVMPAAKITLDGKRENLAWRASSLLQPGEVLEIGAATTGLVGYLHLGGGVATEPVLGSRAVHLRAGIGGGRLEAGDRVPVGEDPRREDPVGEDLEDRARADRLTLPQPGYLGQREIRVLWGPQAELFDAAERQRFLSTEFTVSTHRDRMAARLDGGVFEASAQLTGLSAAVSLGDIQVPGDGAPLVLLADRQPTGGYPRIATVIIADLPAFAQMPSSAPFRFVLVERAAAVKALKAWRDQVKDLAGQVRPLVRDPRNIPDLLSYNLIDGMISVEEELP